ncbi:MAG: hypothetical protein B7733_19590 [Myxococcales bacterium FL481]|nr:MAG: hypothetical protein B7733_19590 [Myxococcales bacterium FL481]
MPELDATEQLVAAPAQALAHPSELELRPLQGLPKWLGNRLAKLVFRAVSMEEQPLAARTGAMSPTHGYYRRDRHVHPRVDAATYKLQISGVADARTLSLSQLEALPRAERVCVMECAGNGNHLMGSAGLMGQARWSGPTLDTLLDLCGGPGAASHFAFRGRDKLWPVKSGYHYGLSLDELRRAGAIVALRMNGEPLSRRHGFPARLIVPRIYSMSHVKWLCQIEGKTTPHRGIHNDFVFTNKQRRDGRWERVQARWIGLKSLVTRCQRVPEGWQLSGWAWGGDRAITRVDVTTDGGDTWHAATLRRPDALFRDAQGPEDLAGAWSTFSFVWRNPSPGRYVVGARSFDEDGTAQVLEEDPNVRGHFNQCRVKWREVVVPAGP